MMLALRRLGVAAIAVIACLVLVWAGLAWLIATPDMPFWEAVKQIALTTYHGALQPGAGPDGQVNYRHWFATLNGTSLILLTGLAVAVAFRASVLNIGGEGQYLAGAIAATAIALNCPGPAWVVIPAVLLGSILAGALVAAIASLLEQWRDVPVVLSTLLLNFVVAVALQAVLQGPLRSPGHEDQSNIAPTQAVLPNILNFNPDTLRPDLYGSLIVALAAALIVWLTLRFTTFGFKLKAVGDNPTASRFAGMKVGRIAALTLAFSGALAGLAGGVRICAYPAHQLMLGFRTDGYGFTGIAVALLGRLSPLGVVLAALFFALLNTTFSALESDLEIPSVAARAAQGIILIVMLIASRQRK